jgi:hypothetical protein
MVSLEKSVKIPGYTAYKYGPKKKDHPTCGSECVACNKPMKEGQYTTLVPIGPGIDDSARKSARNGKGYNAVCVEVHWSCVTGIE